jgi:hypothetical protein
LILIIKSTRHFDNSTSLVCNEASIYKSEHLPPSWVDAFCFQVAWTSVALDCKTVVLPVVVSDSLSDFVEPELLLSCVLSPSSESHLGITMHLSDSIEWKFWNKIEWSIDVESKFFIQSLSFSLCLLIKIKYLPSLVGTVMLIVYTNSLSFFILVSNNINASINLLNVAEMLSLVHKDLPPSWISAPDLHVISFPWTLNIPWLVVDSGSNSQSLLVEVPNLRFSTIGSFEYHVSVVDQINIPIFW